MNAVSNHTIPAQPATTPESAGYITLARERARLPTAVFGVVLRDEKNATHMGKNDFLVSPSNHCRVDDADISAAPRLVTALRCRC